MPIQDYRRLYAEEVRTAAPITSHALLTAFEKVPREKFLGPGPWFAGSRELETNDVRDLYHDVTVAIDRSVASTMDSRARWRSGWMLWILRLATGCFIWGAGWGTTRRFWRRWSAEAVA